MLAAAVGGVIAAADAETQQLSWPRGTACLLARSLHKHQF